MITFQSGTYFIFKDQTTIIRKKSTRDISETLLLSYNRLKANTIPRLQSYRRSPALSNKIV